MSIKALRLEDIEMKYGRHAVLDGVCLDVERGRPCVITGPNGSGKSTLLRIAAGLTTPTGGKVTVVTEHRETAPGECRSRFSVVSPDVRLYDELTLSENLDFIARTTGSVSNAAKSRYKRVFFPEGMPNIPLAGFSSGMKQRAHLLAAFVREPSVLLLDEPTSFLDRAGKQAFEEAFRDAAPGTVVLLASNDPSEISLCEVSYALD